MTNEHLPEAVGFTDPAFLRAVKEALTTPGTRLSVVEDSGAVQADIARRILEASSVEELAKLQGTVSASDLVGHTLKVRGGRWMNSTADAGTGVYAQLDAVDLTDDHPVTVNAGSSNMVATLVKLLDLDALDKCTLKVIEVGKAKPGQSAPLGFEVIPEPSF